MKKIAIFPGSFDPFTIGHENVVRRSLDLFDEIVVAVGYNSNKADFFPVEMRVDWIKDVFSNAPRIRVDKYEGLTVDYAKTIGATHLLRGIRTSADFEYERAIAQVNRAMTGIDTVFLLTTPEHTPVNSSIVRDIIKHGGDASKFLPEKIKIDPSLLNR
ncbi:phosphopantetheine adenylyltransferase [Breznakibacter xylanolyticus]|uniref:Phosphopantetheine adenylyltransferase n=1 Tax=Breznakibacter xylanolyticus TaxID=990 RepID=A0A2W7NL78_9BACT|nr:pantetheine-phosphate adenylyltransferase [Breznakibacter xylanolyticus]MBN2744687.1 pantetheine-phosphate adenylyltransferase [Marinilabiliaceae bacterium]PZX17434.1 phosphopantetheine adenylyltransferase [Breznakibacter xylanolyticus]